MTTQKKWSIDEITSQTEDGLVIEVQWRVSTTGDVKPYSVYGTCKFERGDSFTEFNDLTETTVVGWVKEQLGDEIVSELEEHIDNTVVETGLSKVKPWDSIPT